MALDLDHARKKKKWDNYRNSRKLIGKSDDCFVRYGKHWDFCPICGKDFGKPLPEWDVALKNMLDRIRHAAKFRRVVEKL